MTRGRNFALASTAEAINDALKSASDGALNEILNYCDEPLVPSEFRGSSIIDGLSATVMEGSALDLRRQLILVGTDYS
jgi:glyceraldehyde-3-phosphate dehydrogenase/erythrose-4-phosphate dehydrogenase